MKTAYFVWILAAVGAGVFACNDNEDAKPNHAQVAGSAGKSNTTAGSTSGGKGGAGNGGSTPVGGTTTAHGGTGGTLAGAGGSAGDSGAAGNAGDNGVAGDHAGGAGGEGGQGSVAPFELVGAWNDSFTGPFTITATTWDTSALVAYDNANNVAYTQFPHDDMYNPDKFAKTVYTDPVNGSFYYCMVVYSADTLAEAQASNATADATDPENSGCGGAFPWSKATKQ